MKKRKAALLIGICLLVAGFVTGCAQNNDNMALESDSEAEPENAEVSNEDEKHYWVNRQGEDAYVGVQSAEDTEVWTILNMAGYGDWLEKEISIYIKMITGLDVSNENSTDASDDEQTLTSQENFVPIADLLTDSNAGDSIEAKLK